MLKKKESHKYWEPVAQDREDMFNCPCGNDIFTFHRSVRATDVDFYFECTFCNKHFYLEASGCTDIGIKATNEVEVLG